MNSLIVDEQCAVCKVYMYHSGGVVRCLNGCVQPVVVVSTAPVSQWADRGRRGVTGISETRDKDGRKRKW